MVLEEEGGCYGLLLAPLPCVQRIAGKRLSNTLYLSLFSFQLERSFALLVVGVCFCCSGGEQLPGGGRLWWDSHHRHMILLGRTVDSSDRKAVG